MLFSESSIINFKFFIPTIKITEGRNSLSGFIKLNSMKKYFLFLTLLSFEAKSQDVVKPDTIKQLSVGFNLLKLAGGAPSAIQQVGFIRNRVRNHAFKFVFYTSSFYSGNKFDQLNTPGKISISDSIITISSDYISQTSSGISFSYEKFQLSNQDKNIELFSGFGIKGGTTHHDHGNTTVAYLKDSTGNFVFSDSLSYNSALFLMNNSFKEYNIGIIPYAGVLLMPDKTLSIDFQVSFPMSYNWKIPSNPDVKRSFSFGTEMLYSINIILNFNFLSNPDTM